MEKRICVAICHEICSAFDILQFQVYQLRKDTHLTKLLIKINLYKMHFTWKTFLHILLFLVESCEYYREYYLKIFFEIRK